MVTFKKILCSAYSTILNNVQESLYLFQRELISNECTFYITTVSKNICFPQEKLDEAALMVANHIPLFNKVTFKLGFKLIKMYYHKNRLLARF